MIPKKSVLLVEPDREAAALERFRMGVWGYRVISAPSAEAAVGMLEGRRRQAIDVVLAWADKRGMRRLARGASAWDLHEAIRRHARHKPGPKPGGRSGSRRQSRQLEHAQ